MAINYTTLLGLAKPVTGTESGVWGDVVNDQITSLLEDAIANAASISVTAGNVTLTDNNGSSDQSRMAILLVTGSPGVSRNIVAPSTSKWYIVKNSSNAEIVLKGSATTGVTIPAGAEAFAFWNGSDFELAAMIGPSSSTDNAVARFDGTTGKVVQNSAVTIADTTGDITTSGYVFTAAGAAGTPAYSTSGDTNTGMWFPAADTLAWSTGGSERMRVDASSRLVLNGTDATVGGGQMVVNHGANNGLVVNQTGSGTGAQIYLRNAVDSIINGINFTNPGVRFYDIGTATERMRIDSSGNVGIGTSSPSGKLDVVGDGGTVVASAATNTAATSAQIQIKNSAGAIVFRTLYYGPSYSGGSLFNVGANGTALYQEASAPLAVGTGAAQPLLFGTNGTERMRLDSSGNLGIGTSSPSTALHVATSGGTIQLRLGNNTGADYWGIGRDNVTTGALVFQNQTTERMRVTSGGDVVIGTTTSAGRLTVQTASQIGLHSSVTAGTSSPIYANVNYASSTAVAAIRAVKYDNNTTTSQVFVHFAVDQDSANCGQINANGANTAAFGTYSDARLKENIVDLPPQLASICALRPVEFDYIQSEGGGHQIGFIAQEMEQVYPDVVGERSDGMKTITAWSKTEARLVKAIQEQQAIIDSLVSRIAALESKGA